MRLSFEFIRHQGLDIVHWTQQAIIQLRWMHHHI